MKLQEITESLKQAVEYLEPNLDAEWKEAERYPELAELGLEGWKALKGQQVNVTQLGGLKNIQNTEGTDVNTAKRAIANLEPEKVRRMQQAIKAGVVELPIIAKFHSGEFELVAGNTRFTGLVANDILPEVYYIDLTTQLNENTFKQGRIAYITQSHAEKRGHEREITDRHALLPKVFANAQGSTHWANFLNKHYDQLIPRQESHKFWIYDPKTRISLLMGRADIATSSGIDYRFAVITMHKGRPYQRFSTRKEKGHKFANVSGVPKSVSLPRDTRYEILDLEKGWLSQYNPDTKTKKPTVPKPEIGPTSTEMSPDEEEQAWKDWQKDHPNSVSEQIGDGNCYEAGGRHLMALFGKGNRTAELVHADITPKIGRLTGVTYGHCWIEDGDTVNDVSDNHRTDIHGVLGDRKDVWYGVTDPKNIKRYDFKALSKMITKYKHWGPWETTSVNERPLSQDEKDKKEKNVKGMKKNKKDFEKRYGKDAEAVMYATATKMAKENVVTEGIDSYGTAYHWAIHAFKEFIDSETDWNNDPANLFFDPKKPDADPDIGVVVTWNPGEKHIVSYHSSGRTPHGVESAELHITPEKDYTPHGDVSDILGAIENGQFVNVVLQSKDNKTTNPKVNEFLDTNFKDNTPQQPKKGRLVTKDGVDITDQLPYKTVDFRGDPIVIVDFEAPHKPSSTGRIYTDNGRSFFPGVADLKIIDHDFSEGVVIPGNFPIQQRLAQVKQRKKAEGKQREILKRFAAFWWNNDANPGVEKKLEQLGYGIGRVGHEEGGAFIIRFADAGKYSTTTPPWRLAMLSSSYISWTANELKGIDEGSYLGLNEEEPGKDIAKDMVPTTQPKTKPKTMKRRAFLKKAGQYASAALNPDVVAQLAQLAPTPEPWPSVSLAPDVVPAKVPAKAPYLQHGAWLLRQAYSKVYQFTDDWGSDVPLETMNDLAPEFSDAIDEVDWDFEELVRKVSPEQLKKFLNALEEVEDELKTYSDDHGIRNYRHGDLDQYRIRSQKGYDPESRYVYDPTHAGPDDKGNGPRNEGAFIDQFEPEYSEKKRELANKLRKKLGLDLKPELDWKIELANKMQRAEWVEQFKDLEKEFNEGEVIDFPGTYQKREYVKINGVTLLKDVWGYMSNDRSEDHGVDKRGRISHKRLTNFTGNEEPRILLMAYKEELKRFIDQFTQAGLESDTGVYKKELKDKFNIIYTEDVNEEYPIYKTLDYMNRPSREERQRAYKRRQQELKDQKKKKPKVEAIKPPKGWISHFAIGKLIGNELGEQAEDFWTSIDLKSDDDLMRYEYGSQAAQVVLMAEIDRDVDKINTWLSKYPKHFHFKISERVPDPATGEMGPGLRYVSKEEGDIPEDVGLPIWHVEPVQILVNGLTLSEYGAMADLSKMWSRPVGSQQHLLRKKKKKKKLKELQTLQNYLDAEGLSKVIAEYDPEKASWHLNTINAYEEFAYEKGQKIFEPLEHQNNPEKARQNPEYSKILEFCKNGLNKYFREQKIPIHVIDINTGKFFDVAPKDLTYRINKDIYETPISEEAPTSTPKYLYHVTFKSKIPNIKAKGLEQFHTSLWVKGPGGQRYNKQAGIFAFDHPLDAIGWAQKMEWEFRDDIIPDGNDDVAIIRLDMQDGEEIWGDDPSDDIMLARHGKSFRSPYNIKADKIIDAFNMEEFGKAGVLNISRDQWLSQVEQKLVEAPLPPWLKSIQDPKTGRIIDIGVTKPDWLDKAIALKRANPRMGAQEIGQKLGGIHSFTISSWLTGTATKIPSGKGRTAAPWKKIPGYEPPFKRSDFPSSQGSKQWYDGAKPEWYDKAVEMHKQGVSYRQIANQLLGSVDKTTNIVQWLVKGYKWNAKDKNVINPDAPFEKRYKTKINIPPLIGFIDRGYTDEQIIDLITDKHGAKVASQVITMLPALRQKLKPGTKVIDKTRAGPGPDQEITL